MIRTSALRACRRVWQMVRRIDVRKPVHAMLVGLILAGTVTPVASWMITNERYRLTHDMAMVAELPSPALMSKLRYDTKQRANVFNAEGSAQVDANPVDKLQMSVGAGGKKDKQLYTATMPDDPTKGIVVQDNVNDVAVTFVPQMGLLDGRGSNGRVSYPLKDEAGQIIFTPKGNGLKEDIVLTRAPKDDAVEYRYALKYPDSVEARLEDDGRIGFYTATPELFGNITYGSDKDKDLVEQARKNATKEYLMFAIPAPVIVETGKKTGVRVRFTLDGKDLVVRVTGLKKASYPLSIDPTFVISSSAEFVLGSADDNIDFSVDGQVGRAVLSGGSTPNWGPNGPSMSNGNYAAGLVAYNSYLYYIGGGNQDGTTNNTTTTQVMHVHLNSDGTTDANWTIDTGSPMGTARQGLVAFGYNGYLYAVGGENNSANPISTVEFAKINTDGSVGAWHNTGHLNTARGYLAGAIYQGVLYAIGGASTNFNGGLRSDVEYARVNGDGTIGTCTDVSDPTYKSNCTWSTTSSLSSARNRFIGGAYNGWVYVTGGYDGTNVLNTIEAAPISSDGTLGAWTTTNMTAFPTARRDHGMGLQNGHIYVYGGCSVATIACTSFLGDTRYAVINADGTIGQWQSTVPYNVGGYGARTNPSSAVYNNFLYFVGGCAAETAGSIHCNSSTGFRTGTFYSGFDKPGRYDRGIQGVQTTPPYNNNAATVARMGAQGVALNGYMYLIGGCSTTSCNTATAYSSVVEYAAINGNGSLGTWATTSALITTDTTNNNPGRHGLAVVAYNDKIYVIGGLDRTKANGNSYRAEVLSATQASSGGTLGTWSAEANSLPAARAFGKAVVWHNWIFYAGGVSNSTTVSGTIYRAQITGNAPGTWAATTNGLTNARWGHSIGLWGNWLYVVGGQSNTTGTYITAANATEKLTITNAGDITSAATVYTTATGQPQARFAGGFVNNGYLYVLGGYRSGSTSASAVINWTRLDATTGDLLDPTDFTGQAWSATNIGNNAATYGLATARGMTTAVVTGGNIYTMGGCTSTLTASSFVACSTFVTTTNTTEVNLPNNGGTGQTSTWTTGSSNVMDLSSARADHAVVAYNSKLYVIGGCSAYTAGECSTELGDIQRADISADGKITGSWTAQTSLPGGEVRGQLQAAAYNGWLYVLGGRSAGAGATASVWYIDIESTGDLGASWNNVSNALGDDMPGARRAFGAAISAGYIYAVGGEDASGTRQSAVYYAAVNADGTLGSWSTTTALPSARAEFGFTAYNGVLYVVGGYDGSTDLTDVLMGDITVADGTIGAWSYVTDVAQGTRGRQAVSANGYLYFVGDEGDTTEATYVNINANGTTGTIQRSDNVMNGSHAHGAAVAYDGVIYVTGGCTLSGTTCSTVSAVNDMGGQQAISRMGHYSKLFDTQVDTSPTQLVINGATNGPGSVVEFKFQTASQSDPVLGVALLIRPVVFGNYYNVQALNSSGTNVGVAFNYQYIITLDDSKSGTFPDVPNSGAGFAQTAVTDITLYYHANPSRRLRHGASFTDTGCNPVVSEGCILDTAP